MRSPTRYYCISVLSASLNTAGSNDAANKPNERTGFFPNPKPIPFLTPTAALSMLNSIICCSTNGSIREWSVAHEVKNTRFLAQMWEHNGFITDVVSLQEQHNFHHYYRLVYRMYMTLHGLGVLFHERLGELLPGLA